MLNKVLYQGRFVTDPELRTTPNGKTVVSFTLAWNMKYKEREDVCFLNCYAWDGTAELISRCFSKGKDALIEGSLRQRSWTTDEGKTRNVLECLVSAIHFTSSKSASSQQPQAQPQQPTNNYAQAQTSFNQTANNFMPVDDDDGDLPF